MVQEGQKGEQQGDGEGHEDKNIQKKGQEEDEEEEGKVISKRRTRRMMGRRRWEAWAWEEGNENEEGEAW